MMKIEQLGHVVPFGLYSGQVFEEGRWKLLGYFITGQIGIVEESFGPSEAGVAEAAWEKLIENWNRMYGLPHERNPPVDDITPGM